MINRLSSRETRVIWGGGLVLACFFLIQFVYLPALDRRDDLEQRLAGSRASLERMAALRKEYLDLSRKADSARILSTAKPADFSLFSFIDRRASETRVKDRIGYMKPLVRPLENRGMQLSCVKLTLKGVYLDDLMGFVTGIETREDGVWISSMELSAGGAASGKPGESLLEAVMEIQTIVREGGQ